MIYSATKLAYKQYSDTDLIARIIEGDHPLYEIIVRRYNPYLYKIGRTYGFNHEDTEDLMQNTYLNAFYSIQQFKNKATFKTWITRIMLNQCYQSKLTMNKKGITTSAYSPDQIEQSIPENESTMDEGSMIRKELGHLIETAINQLPEPYKIVFTLRELNQHKVAETAELLNITESNVKVRLNRAKAMIKANLYSNYGSENVFKFNEVYCDRIVKRVLDKIL